jgi:CubicO group peptidase (beta-lactamase class C family)
MSNPISSGLAWAKLAKKVDALVAAVMAKENLPGVSVAVTKAGRLILSKGYGFALVDGKRTLPLRPCARLLIGSSTKATITGPSGYQLMKSQNIDPKTTKLYGAKGFFGGIFDDDIAIGVQKGITEKKPNASQWKAWYEKITLQHLLDHKAGFENPNADSPNVVAAEFGLQETALTITHFHAFFLRTYSLRYEPGNPPAGLDPRPYSNHGFGLWALLIEKMSGKHYRNYVRGHYLKPLQLHNGVTWQRINTDSCDAYGHSIDANQQLKPKEFGESTLASQIGLAAGGWKASATSVVKLMADLAKNYSAAELDSMGWGNAGGKLQHNGAINAGGASYVMMHPKGFKGEGNLDLGEVHVAIVTNLKREGELGGLANKIAEAVPTSDVPANFDLWSQHNCSCEYVRRSVPADEYQAVFDDAERSDYRLEWIEGHTIDGKLHFNVIFRAHPTTLEWVSNHNMTGAAYQLAFDQRKAQGFALVHVDSYVVGNSVLYAAIWTKGATELSAYHGVTPEAHQKSFDTLTAQGWKPKVISVVSIGGKLQYTALYDKQAIGAFEARSALTAAEYQLKFDQNSAAGRHLHYLNSFVHGGKIHFSAIWADKPKIVGSKAQHGMTAAQFLTTWEDAVMGDSFKTRAITAWEEGGKAKYAAYWAK